MIEIKDLSQAVTLSAYSGKNCVGTILGGCIPFGACIVGGYCWAIAHEKKRFVKDIDVMLASSYILHILAQQAMLTIETRAGNSKRLVIPLENETIDLFTPTVCISMESDDEILETISKFPMEHQQIAIPLSFPFDGRFRKPVYTPGFVKAYKANKSRQVNSFNGHHVAAYDNGHIDTRKDEMTERYMRQFGTELVFTKDN